jgi:hypothetical protein
MRALGVNMPGAYGLLPSSAYFGSVSDPVASFETSPILPWTFLSVFRFGSAISDFGTLTSFLSGIEGRKQPSFFTLSTPSILNSSLLEAAEAFHGAIDVWRPLSGTNIWQVAGWGLDTVRGLRYYAGLKKGKGVIQYDPVFTEDGDGTVVVPSALWLPTAASNGRRYWLDLPSVNKGNFTSIDHGNILESVDLREFIQSIIIGSSSPSRTHISTSTPHERSSKRLAFILHSSSFDMSIYDDKGNYTGFSTTTGDVEEGVPDTSYGRFGDVLYVTMPAVDSGTNRSTQPRSRGSHARIVITAPQEPDDDSYTLDAGNVGVSGTLDDKVSFVDVSMQASSTATLEVPDDLPGMGSLYIDDNVDGIPDRHIEPVSSTVSTTAQVEVRQASARSGRSRVLATSSTEHIVLDGQPVLAHKEVPARTSTTEPRRGAVPIPSKPIDSAIIQTASAYAAIESFRVGYWVHHVFTALVSLFAKLLGGLW